MKSSPQQYCEMVCNKICLYIQRIYKIDIIRLTVEFCIDEFGKVWVLFAKNIWIRQKTEHEKNYDQMLSQFFINQEKESR